MEDIISKVRHIEWKTRKVVDSLLAGEYRTKFRGHGMQFSEFREYEPGDDVRHISWVVSARKQDTVIKLYEEERELNVMLVVDRSSSLSYGSGSMSKQEVMAETACAMAFAAVRNQDRIGVIGFGSNVEFMVKPAKGQKHVLRIVKQILTEFKNRQTTNLDQALVRAERVMPQKGIIVIISDFLCDFDERLIHRLSRKHQLLVIDLSDPLDYSPPSTGFVELIDPETGFKVVELFSKKRSNEWKNIRSTHREKLNMLSKKFKCPFLSLDTSGDHLDKLVRFLSK